jgi:hypothetical protein
MLLFLAPLSAMACVTVRYQARQSLPGEPAAPATRAEGVTSNAYQLLDRRPRSLTRPAMSGAFVEARAAPGPGT